MSHTLKKIYIGVSLSILAVCLHANGAIAFNASRIIDDSVFVNKNAMSVSDIQNFLNSKVPTCSPGATCLRSYSEGGKSSAQIIYENAQAFNLNPQVLIVTLQKENSLITHTSPESWRYRTAMGFACPDNGSCNPEYYGFAKQVYQGARHLRNFYDQNPNWFIPHRAGVNNVKYNVNTGCGSSQLNINKATSALYSYTPYQPNAAALNNMYGTGDGCSAYGNRNFWRDFTNWFGTTYQPAYTWEWVSQSSDKDITRLPAGTKATLYLTAKNTGTATWHKNSSNQVNLGTWRPEARNSIFIDPGWWINNATAARLNQDTVAPGQNGTFTFIIQAPQKPGTYREHFNLLAQNVSWMNDVGLFWDLGVVSPDVQATITDLDAPTTMEAESTATVTAKIRNDSDIIWYNTDRYPLRIGTSGPLERTSPFKDSSWLSDRRTTKMFEYQVSPGETGTFTFTIKAPRKPGQYTENFSLLAENLTWFPVNISLPITVKGPYTWAWESQAAFTNSGKGTPADLSNMSAGQTAWLQVRARNTGTSTWTNSGANPVRIGTANPLERTSRFATGAWLRPSRPSTLIESSVAPGEIGTFEFPIQIPAGGGAWREYFNLLAEDRTWMNEDVGQFFPITVKDRYTWSWESQDSFTDSSKGTPLSLNGLAAGQTAWLQVRARNTGTATWLKTGNYPVRIGTSGPLERPSRFATSDWLKPSRPGGMVESSVAPGEVGTFEFPINVPSGQGNWREYFNLLAEDYTWMNDNVGQFFPITVKGPYTWAWESQAAFTNSGKGTPADLSNMSAGQTAWLQVRARNTGTSTWTNSGANPVRIGTANPLERTSRFATGAWLRPSRPSTLIESSVAPGEIGTFEFPIQIPAGGGAWREYFNLLAEDRTWMNEDVGQFFPITVR